MTFNSMESVLSNVEYYATEITKELLVLVLVFTISVLVRWLQWERRDKYFDENMFFSKYCIAHGMACIFALIYTCFFGFISSGASDSIAVIMLVVFYVFLTKIIMTQNAEKGGYIENMDGASGAIMYISAALSPTLFVIVHVVLVLISFWFYKREDNDSKWKKRMINRGVDSGEAIIAIIMTCFIPHELFIENLRLNVFMISVFTLILPFINESIIYKRIDD